MPTVEPLEAPARRFYVSAINGPRRAFLAGPFLSHAAALAVVDTTRNRAEAIDPAAHFWLFGTASSDADRMTAFGVLTT